ncbi:polymorphic toxin-type HINT domain-containing protein [Streptomyces sp. WMMC500]|uniref:LamG-like jellyroll fold domain-containing protein n=1 Tax=Streptomyces sp. WMMC500 TaxID=3015154 RepID=UPI00248D31BF|nr:LamG-like jellyroll fold domain-containing protein [Streptomyces sp. WMMC500]WBB58179.1 polymorphic toxin-type HINT domain-containing protein [Streptomyces sp. WMMC500]
MPAYRRIARYVTTNRLRRGPFATAVAVLLAAVIGITSLALSGSGIPLLPGDPPAPGTPDQRWGDAGGRDHLVRERDANRRAPTTHRAKYPTGQGRSGDARPSQPENDVRVAAAPEPAGSGFEPGRSRELPGERTAYSRTYANDDGTHTTETSPDPLNFRDADGEWYPIDTTLRARPGGWDNAADSVDVRLGDSAADTRLAGLRLPSGAAVSYGLHGAARVPGSVDGSKVTYEDVLPDTGLWLESQPGGVKETLVLHSPDAPAVFRFPLALDGLRASLHDGSVVLRDADGRTRAVIPPGFMDDSAAVPARSDGVAYRLVGEPGAQSLEVTLDRRWLRADDRVFPVRVDPSVRSVSAGTSAYVKDGGSVVGDTELQVGKSASGPTATYLGFPDVDEDFRNHKIFGVQLQLANFDSASCKSRPVTVHPVTESWSAGTGMSYPGPATGPSLASKSFAHGHIKLGDSKSDCPARNELFNLGKRGRDLVQRWVSGRQPNHGLSVRAAAEDLAWKKFAGHGTANPPKLFITHSPYAADYRFVQPVPDPPVLQNQDGKVKLSVTNKGAQTWTPGGYYLAYRAFDAKGKLVTQQRAANLTGEVPHGSKTTLTATIKKLPPGRYTLDFTMVRTGGTVFTDEQVPPARLLLQVFDIAPVVQEQYPPNGYFAQTLTPHLWASAIDVDAPAGQTLEYKFEVCERGDDGKPTGCTTSAYQSSPAWTVPAGRLSWGKTYLWRGFVKDAGNEVPTDQIALLTSVPQPEITSRIADGQANEADPLTGNYSTTAIDASLAGIGPDLTLVRSYNSLDPRRDLAFGAGWTSRYDVRLSPDDDGSGNVVIRYPDGRDVRYGKNPDGSYEPPPGRYARLTRDATANTWTLQDKSGTRYSFSSSGLLVKITDATSNAVTYTYSGGRIAKAENARSGRSLTFAWTGDHVTSVRTNPVGGAALAWDYTYAGDRLDRVCAPDGSCTSYEYTAGNHYATAVRDSRPESHWRLGEGEGTAAESTVDVNLGDDRGTHHGVTLGAQGAVSGDPDTAAVFDGNSSRIQLPGGTLKKSRDTAVELWFKTIPTGVGGPLLGYQDKAWGTAPTSGVPTLYVGTDGKLRGQFWNGTAQPITATTKNVNDGNWHHAVLSVSGQKQSLYLDGQLAGTLDGAPLAGQKLTHNQIGAAHPDSPANWPGWGSAQARHFAGSIDEVSVYAHPLGPQSVAAHHTLGKQGADLLTRIALPSGRTGAEVTYDTSADRVEEYTDGNGGTWRYGRPAVYGDETDMRRTIEVQDPLGHPYFYEYDALTSQLVRYGEPMALGVREADKPGEPSTSPPDPPDEVCSQPDPGDPAFCTNPPGDGGSEPDFIRHPVDGVAIRSFTYDDKGYQTGVTSETGDTVTLAYDDRGNITSRTTCRAKDDCQTSHTSYPTDLPELDPRKDLPTGTRDGRSSGPSDDRYLTAYTYNPTGALLTQKNPDGGTTRHTYTTGAEPARDGGQTPTGLPKTTTDPRGAETRYAYYRSGDLAEVVQPSGLTARYTYDELGRLTGETEISDSRPSGVTTTYTYDKLSRPVTVTEPEVANAVTAAPHRMRTTTAYDPDGFVTRVEISDAVGADPSRSMTFEPDEHGRPARVTDAEGNESTYGYDVFGNQTFMVDANGNRYEYAYTARNMAAEVRLVDWDGDPEEADDTGDFAVLNSYSYDMAGRLARQTDAMGRTLEYQYYGDDLVRSITLKDFHAPDGSTHDYVLEANEYDDAGNVVREVTGNGRTVTTSTYDAVGRVKGTVAGGAAPGPVQRATYDYDLAGNVTRTTSGGSSSNVPWPVSTTPETVDYVYDGAGRLRQEIVLNGSADLTTTYDYDQRNLTTAVTDPLGRTTNLGYDALGRRVSTTAPQVQAEPGDGTAAQPVRPLTVTGLTMYGEVTESVDPLGNTTRATYDDLGRQTSVSAPPYTAPGSSTAVTPTTHYGYDALGNVTEVTDPLERTSRYSYDRMNRLTERDEPTGTGDDRATWSYTYTRTGEVLSVTGPTGARAEVTYDDLDRPLTQTRLERHPEQAAFTTAYRYDDSGNVTAITDPSGAETHLAYDSLSQATRVTEPSGVFTQFGYDGSGREVRRSDGLGRTSRQSYDDAGRLVQESDLDANMSPLRAMNYDYDDAGNLTASTDPLGRTTTYAHDALGRLTEQTEPVSETTALTTSFGYDAAGNRTRYTDGRGNSTHYTVNSLGLPETAVEPATADHPAVADRTWTTAYDAAGQAVEVRAPGGVTRQRTYDNAGQLVLETGGGAEATTTERAYGYDAAGRLTSAASPTGDNTYSYNDRGLLLEATGPAGEASYTYDEDGLLRSRTDAAGTAQFTYVDQRLASATDPLTGARQSYAYDEAGMLEQTTLDGGRARTFTYDDVGRIDSDTLTDAGGQTVASIDYEFDDNDHLTAKNTAGLAGPSQNSYGYDHAGRLTSWTADGATTEYAWDDAGNRTKNGDETAAYDERNRLLSDGDYAYEYSARGALTSRTSSGLTEEFAFDAFDRLVNAGSVSYDYDSLDRVAARGGADFSYAGLAPDPVKDGTASYGRGAMDELLSVAEDGGTPRLAFTDAHGDVVGGYEATAEGGAELAESAAYTPFGEPAGEDELSGNAGYQGDWTDPDSGQVNMGARWYDPGAAGFVSRDAATYASGPSAFANRYGYAAASPMDHADPDGNFGFCLPCGLLGGALALARAYLAKTIWSGLRDMISGVADRVRDLLERRRAAKKTAAAMKEYARQAWRAAKSAARSAARVADRAAARLDRTGNDGYHRANDRIDEIIRGLKDKGSSASDWAEARAREAKRRLLQEARDITNRAKAAVKRAITNNPLPAVTAALKPLYEVAADIVSSAPNVAARVVDVTRDVIADAAQSADNVRAAAVAAAGDVVQEVSAAVDAGVEFARNTAPAVRDALGTGLSAAAELTGYNDFKDCLTKGDMEACAWATATLAGAAAGGAGAGAVRAAKAGRMATKTATTVGKNADRVESAVDAGTCVAEGASAAASANSFTAGTEVVMADGSRKPIEDVEVGDKVRATDPTTGETSDEKVTATIEGTGEKHLVDLTVAPNGPTDDATATLTATEGHPFWVPALKKWQGAGDLKPGQWLQTGAGTYVQLTAVRARTAETTVHNLTVDDAHTYHVAVGMTDTLVHNCDPADLPDIGPAFDDIRPASGRGSQSGDDELERSAERKQTRKSTMEDGGEASADVAQAVVDVTPAHGLAVVDPVSSLVNTGMFVGSAVSRLNKMARERMRGAGSR